MKKIFIKKRDGRKVMFNEEKIINAILGAFKDVDGEINDYAIEKAKNIAIYVREIAEASDKMLDVETIQNMVEDGLARTKRKDVAKQYILYRNERSKARDIAGLKVKDILSNEQTEEKTENANINGFAFMGKMLHIGEEMCRRHALNELVKPEIAEAHKQGFIYIHDAGWYSIGLSNCLSHDLAKELRGGFYAGHGFLREPQSIATAFTLASIVLESAQNNFFGGQALANVDYAFEPYIKKSFYKHFLDGCIYLTDIDIKTLDVNNEMSIEDPKYKNINDKVYNYALNKTLEETLQGAEGFVHNCSNLESRSGSQAVFSSITYGMNTSPEGRMVINALLEAQIAGLGHHETAVFPIAIFTVKDGVNFKQGDPNYDMYKKAMYCSTKRMFPTYIFLDAPHNLPYYREGDPYSYVQAMGKCKCSPCKTNMNSYKRGVLYV